MRRRTWARAALAVVLGSVLAAGPPAPVAHAESHRATCGTDAYPCAGVNWLYEYNFSLGMHPFTTPHDIRSQLTQHFWLFPVAGRDCRGPVRQGDRCALVGGNPVSVERVGSTFFQIATLPGHSLGDGLHIRFSFSRTLGMHALTVRAWYDEATTCTNGCSVVSGLFALAVWQVLADTLKISAFAA
ncbi:hypothetical protein [Streptomyces sp. bgisy031]|uniref:hypothetical protein n=1 Tax=Streptomyces sp. bgisy031 TaxID=3413772 RepID=UPI003D7158F8